MKIPVRKVKNKKSTTEEMEPAELARVGSESKQHFKLSMPIEDRSPVVAIMEKGPSRRRKSERLYEPAERKFYKATREVFDKPAMLSESSAEIFYNVTRRREPGRIEDFKTCIFNVERSPSGGMGKEEETKRVRQQSLPPWASGASVAQQSVLASRTERHVGLRPAGIPD